MESDITLLAAARNINGDALLRIFELYATPLYKYAFRLCNNVVMADQIVGDVFAKLLEHLSAGTVPSANLRLYLFGLAYRVFIEEVRIFYSSAPIEAVGLTYTDGFSTHGSAENRVLFETVTRAIMNDLTEDQRHVVILRFMEDFSLKETAVIIGKKVGNVKVIQNRAIAALRKALDDQAVETRAISSIIRGMATT